MRVSQAGALWFPFGVALYCPPPPPTTKKKQSKKESRTQKGFPPVSSRRNLCANRPFHALFFFFFFGGVRVVETPKSLANRQVVKASKAQLLKGVHGEEDLVLKLWEAGGRFLGGGEFLGVRLSGWLAGWLAGWLGGWLGGGVCIVNWRSQGGLVRFLWKGTKRRLPHQ